MMLINYMYQVVLCTCPSNSVAKELATTLIEEKLAACVNILPGVTSVYAWQDKIESGTETMLMIKTFSASFEALSERINTLHPYDVPEIIALNIQQGNNEYLNWITESLK